MEKKIFRIAYTILMAAVFMTLLVFLVIHIRNGNGGSYAKLYTAGYILMLIWSGSRLYSIVKDIIKH